MLEENPFEVKRILISGFRLKPDRFDMKRDHPLLEVFWTGLPKRVILSRFFADQESVGAGV
jgi:hypothetical protein